MTLRHMTPSHMLRPSRRPSVQQTRGQQEQKAQRDTLLVSVLSLRAAVQVWVQALVPGADLTCTDGGEAPADDQTAAPYLRIISACLSTRQTWLRGESPPLCLVLTAPTHQLSTAAVRAARSGDASTFLSRLIKQ